MSSHLTNRIYAVRRYREAGQRPDGSIEYVVVGTNSKDDVTNEAMAAAAIHLSKCADADCLCKLLFENVTDAEQIRSLQHHRDLLVDRETTLLRLLSERDNELKQLRARLSDPRAQDWTCLVCSKATHAIMPPIERCSDGARHMWQVHAPPV